MQIRQMTYQPPAGTGNGDGDGAGVSVETMSFGRLRDLDRGLSERGDFFVVALVESGQGSVAVDYAEIPLARRSVVWIAPGVVHRWTDITSIEGDIVLFLPTAPVAPSARALTSVPGAGAVWTTSEREWWLICRSVAHLRSEFEDVLRGGPRQPPEILGSLLSAFLLRAAPAEQLAVAGDDLFQRFRSAVEVELGHRHSMEHYARMLGFSARTMTRAVQSSTGRSAKAYVSERIILEAKRLLAHEGCSLKVVAQRLGFADASALSAFFRRETGETPGAWRARVL